MKNCKYCGAVLADDARACSNCGRPTGYVPMKSAEEKRSGPELNTAEQESSPVSDSWNAGEKKGSGNDPWSDRQQNDSWNDRQQNDSWSDRQQVPPYGYPYGQYGQPMRTSGYAVASFLLGIASPFLNSFYMAPSVLAIVFGVLGVLQCNRQSEVYKGKWMAVTGIVLGGVFLLIYLVLFYYAFRLLQDPEFYSFFQEYMEQVQSSIIFR